MWRTVFLALLFVGCTGPAAAPEPRAERAHQADRPSSTGAHGPRSTASIATEETAPADPPTHTEPGAAPIALSFDWPTPSEAEVRVVSVHDFGGGAEVSATYRYRLTVTRQGEAYSLTRTGIALEAYEGEERLRLGNVLAQDVTQHTGEVRIAADGSQITPVSGFDPIEAAARTVLAQAGIDGTFADAILQLDRNGWQALAVIDLDSMVHEWRGRSLVLGHVEVAEALQGVDATRVLRAVNVACGAGLDSTCVELVRTERGETGHGHLEHVYVLLADSATLRPHRFEHEAHTVDTARSVDYSERWVTTFDWR